MKDQAKELAGRRAARLRTCSRANRVQNQAKRRRYTLDFSRGAARPPLGLIWRSLAVATGMIGALELRLARGDGRGKRLVQPAFTSTSLNKSDVSVAVGLISSKLCFLSHSRQNSAQR